MQHLVAAPGQLPAQLHLEGMARIVVDEDAEKLLRILWCFAQLSIVQVRPHDITLSVTRGIKSTKSLLRSFPISRPTGKHRTQKARWRSLFRPIGIRLFTGKYIASDGTGMTEVIFNQPAARSPISHEHIRPMSPNSLPLGVLAGKGSWAN